MIKKKSHGPGNTKTLDPREAMKAKRASLDAKKAGGGSGDGEGSYYKLEDGKNVVRIMPVKDCAQFYIERMVHFRIGPQQKTVLCVGEKCPICKKYTKEVASINAKYGRGDEKGKRLWKQVTGDLKAKNRYYMYAWNPDQPSTAVKVLSCGDMIMHPMLNYFFDEEECGDFTAKKTGRNVIIDKTGAKMSTEYGVRMSTSAKNILNEQWATLVAQTGTAEELAKVAGEVLSPEAIRGLMDGIDPEESEDEDDDASDDDDEDETEEESEDEEEASEDDGEEDDELSEDVDVDEDEEEEKPAKKAAPSGFKKKLKAKAR